MSNFKTGDVKELPTVTRILYSEEETVVGTPPASSADNNLRRSLARESKSAEAERPKRT